MACGKDLSGTIPKVMVPNFKGKGPKDVKVQVDGQSITFTFTWAFGGGFMGFGKKAVTWSAAEKVAKPAKV
ncbi:MAG: hypothetical protein SGJ02_12825 [bacterium]|nr:hypothetical protein [bacterium]